MDTPAGQPSIPAQALARQAELRAALRAMEEAGLSQENPCLQSLRAWIKGALPISLDAMAGSILEAGLAEEADDLARSSRREVVDRSKVEALLAWLSPHVVRARQRRTALWQLDTRRTMIRMAYAKTEGALGLDEGDIHAIFLQAFRLEGIQLQLDLGKRPRPLLGPGLPLPVGVGAAAEPMDATLKQEPPDDPEDLLARLNRRLPAGLRVHQWVVLPTYASSIGELALRSHWRWEVPPGQRVPVSQALSAFEASETWCWNRGADKATSSMEIRNLVFEIRWEATALCFATGMGPFQGLNPLKMLGAITRLGPDEINGLVRVAVELKPDERLGQAERFEPKLKNMYEDAVLLGGGSNIVIVDEEDDEPLRLG